MVSFYSCLPLLSHFMSGYIGVSKAKSRMSVKQLFILLKITPEVMHQKFGVFVQCLCVAGKEKA